MFHRAFALPLLLCCGFLSAAEPVKYLVLVSVDGLGASYLKDPRAEMPVLRKLAKEGAVASGMKAAFPTVTWPTHTSLVTGVPPGKHGVLGNNVWDRKKERQVVYIGDPELTKDEAVRVPTIYDVAHQAGLKCGAVIWPACTAAKTLDWVIPDAGKAELHLKFTTPGLVDECKAAGIEADKLGEWGWSKEKSTDRDILYTKVTKFLLEKKGANLVLVHLITPDGVEHNYGPNTPEAYAAVKDADTRIGEIYDTLAKPPFAGKSTLIVVSDHGFAPYQKRIHPNTLLREMGLIDTEDGTKPTMRRAWAVAQGGSAFVYVLDEAKKKELLPQVKTKLAATEGINSVLEPAEFAKLGLDTPETNVQAPDLVLLTGPGYSFTDTLDAKIITEAGGLKGTHGHEPSPDYMHATFVAVGAGIKPGVELGVINNTDVAPTMAKLMGLEMKNVDGKALEKALAP